MTEIEKLQSQIDSLRKIVRIQGQLIRGLFAEELGQGRLDPIAFADLLASSIDDDLLSVKDHQTFLSHFDALERQHLG